MRIMFVLLVFVSGLFGQAKLDENFTNLKGTIVVHDQKTDTYTIINRKRAETRYSPFSTYKIPNSIIILETDIISDIDQIVKWDRQRVSSRTTRLVKSILVQEQEKNYTLSAKTGGGYIDQEQNTALGWYVGYVEKEDNVYYFALNIEDHSFSEIQKPRIEITKNILKQLGITQ